MYPLDNPELQRAIALTRFARAGARHRIPVSLAVLARTSMGKTRWPYNEEFLVGTKVRVDTLRAEAV